MAGGNIVTLTESNFDQEVLQSDLPVLIDFWAVWCAPCSMISPIVESMAQEYQGKLKVGKVNVDESSHLAVRYGIRAIPTLLLFKGGKVVEQVIGVQPKEAIINMINEYIQE